MEKKVIVVGAGFSGAVVAERIAEVLKRDVLLVERREHIGGNSYDFVNRHGIHIHKYGPHIFHTDKKEVFEYLSKFTGWKEYKHRVLVNIKGELVPLPFNFYSIEKLFPLKEAEIFKSLLSEKYGVDNKVPVYELLNSNSKELKTLGKFVYDNIFKEYSFKQWGRDVLLMDKTILKRVPVFIGYTYHYFDDPFQFMPEKGFYEIFKNMLSSPKIELILGQDFKEIVEFKDGQIYIEGKAFKGIVVYTGAIDHLFSYKFGKLAYRSLHFQFEDMKKEKYQPVSVVNYPQKKVPFTRITEYKHFLKEKSEYTTISKEYPGEHEPEDDKFNEPYYPVLDKYNKNIFSMYLGEAQQYKNLFLLGRLAEYKYINMGEAVFNALSFFERLKNGL